MKKRIYPLLALLGLTLCLVGCKAPAAKEVVLVSAEHKSFNVVRPDEASDAAAGAAGRLRMAIADECGDGTVGIATDYVGKRETFPTDAKEILVGRTNREESALAYALLPDRPNNKKDFAIAYYGNKLALAGGSDEALADAAAYFTEHFVKDGKVTVPENLSYVYEHEYPSFMVNGTELAAFSLVYPEDANELYRIAAEDINAVLEKNIGYSLPLVGSRSDELPEHTVRITPVLSDNGEYTVTVNGAALEITGGSRAVEYAASEYGALSALFAKSENLSDGEIIKENRFDALRALSSENTEIAPPADSADYGRNAYAYHIIDDDNTRRGSLTSSWDYDGRGAAGTQGYRLLFAQAIDVSDTEPSYLTRPITPQSEGVLTFETSFGCSEDGPFIALCSKRGESVLYLEFVKGALCIRKPDGTLEKIANRVSGSDQMLKATADFSDKTVSLCYDNTELGSFPFADVGAVAEMLRFGVTAEKQGTMTPIGVKMYANYLVNERFIGHEDSLPADFEIHSYNGELCAIKPNGGMFGGNFDNKCLEAVTDELSIRKSFEKASGRVTYELKFMLPARADHLSFGLESDGKTAFSVQTQNFGLFSGSGVLLKDYYSENVWHTLRIEADTASQKALVRFNGKNLGEFSFESASAYFDAMFVRYKGDEPIHLYLDEISVFALPELADYVPEPVISEDSDTIVGINVCSLWREGTHFGWDKISAYDEIKPLLGFYDEGVPEVMDWEIKWMTEHGIDFQLFCWYASSPNTPMMHTHLFDALMNGYMNARYSDRMKFALLWECANAARPQSSEDFRRNFVPYWVEHYLSDERYMSVDGKALLAIFGANKLIDSLGGTNACRAEFDYLDEICKELGYDGVMVIACDSGTGSLHNLKKAGFDAVYAYNWGKSGYDPAYTKKAIGAQLDKNAIRVIPTLSTGFNNVGWAGTRSPNMSVSDFESMLRYFRDDLLESDALPDGKTPFIMLSTWNEFGEGTYITPSGLNGFGYLDALRRQFGNSTVEHEDVTPSEESMRRFTQMYAPDRAALEPLYRYTPTFNGEYAAGWDFKNESDRKKWGEAFGLAEFSAEDDCIRGSGNVNDYAVNCTDMSGMDIQLDDIACIKVVMEVSDRSTAQFFFLTESDGEWNGTKSLSAIVGGKEGRHEYIFSAKNVLGWTGKLKALRFDPMDAPGSFAIESIAFYKNEPVRLFIDGESIPSDYGYETGEHDVRIAINPETGILARLGVGHRWNKAEKSLTLYNADAGVRFTIGSDTALLGIADCYGYETDSGESLALSVPVAETDGLPVISMSTLAGIFGYTADFDEEQGVLHIRTK